MKGGLYGSEDLRVIRLMGYKHLPMSGVLQAEYGLSCDVFGVIEDF